MTKSKVATLVVVVMVLVLPALSAAAGQTTVTSVYTVDGKISGFNTGLVLTDGMSVTATATGVVCAYLNNFCTSPSGDVSYDTTSGLFGGFVLPGAPAFGLVGRVGNGPWVQVGTGPTTLSGTGALVFSVNDYYSTFWDNSGSFSVTVTRPSVCIPGWGRGATKHSHVGPPGLLDSCYPGNGYGDPNHSHAGPPGLTDNPGGGRKAGAASGSNNGSKPGGDSASNGNGQHAPGDSPNPPMPGKDKK